MSADRFRSTVPYYVKYRPRYPPELLDRVADVLALDGRGRLLDLGCGPGTVAIALAARFEEVVGLDPEPAMLEAARREAASSGVSVTLVLGTDGDLGPQLGRFRVVTIGRSFHWMNENRTLTVLDPMVVAGGGVVLLRIFNPDTPENAWCVRWNSVRRRYSAEARTLRAEDTGGEAPLRDSAFSAITRLSHRWSRRLPIDDLVGRALAMSSTSPAVLGERRGVFEADLRRALAPDAVDGFVEEVLDAEALVAKRPDHARLSSLTIEPGVA